MALHRIDWPAAAAGGARVGRCILVAGLPWAIVPEGQTITSVSWTDDADTAWHVGATPACKAWLLLRSEHNTSVPSAMTQESASPVQGTVDVGSLRFWLASTDDAATQTLGAADAIPYTRLVGDHTAAATTLTVESTAAFGSAGALHLGRERITYTGKTSTTFTGCARGTAGTRARPYNTAGALFRVYEAGAAERLPAVIGRRCTVWFYRLSDAGVATDPTLVYDGRIASGSGIVDNSAWELVVEHAAKALDQEATPPTLTIYGYRHGTAVRSMDAEGAHIGDFCPLLARWVDPSGTERQLSLNEGAADPDNGGWSETRERYLDRWNRAGRADGFGITATLRPDGILRVAATDATNDRRLTVGFGWTETQAFDPPDPDDARGNAEAYSNGPEQMPEACFWLSGKVYLDAAAQAAIPATPTYPLTGGCTAWWTITAERNNGSVERGEVVARIQVPGLADASPTFAHGIYCTPVSGADVPRGSSLGLLFTRPAIATLGLHANGPRWWNVFRYAVLDLIDGLRGLDQIADSVAWERLADLASRVSGHPTVREYTVDLAAPPLDILRNEARLYALALSTWHGRVSLARCGVVSPSEATAATLTSAHLRRGEVATVRDATDGLATGYKLTLPSGDAIVVNDAGAVAESGAHDTIEASLPPGALPRGAGVTSADFQRDVIRVAAATLAPYVRAYRVVAWPGDLRLAGLQIGDGVTLSEWLVPDGEGARGLDAAAGVVVGRRVDYDAGTVDLEIRLSPSAVAGYAPAAFVSSIAGAVLTLDTTQTATDDGASRSATEGVAPRLLDSGGQRTDGGASFFVPGDKVYLLEWGTSPASPFTAEVVSTSGATVTLNASPGSSWETLAASAAGVVMLSYDTHANATGAQRRYAFIADVSTYQLSTGAQGRRWT